MFTSEEAYEASQEGDPIIITAKRARRLIEVDHQSPYTWEDFVAQRGAAEKYDAWTVLAWLGY